MMGQQTPLTNGVVPSISVAPSPPVPPVNGAPLPSANNVSNVANGTATAAAKKGLRSGYNAKAMEKIRNSLRPFEDRPQSYQQQQQQNLFDPSSAAAAVVGRGISSPSNVPYAECLQSLMNLGFDEDVSYRALCQSGGRVDTALELLRGAAAQHESADVTNGLGQVASYPNSSSSRSTTPICPSRGKLPNRSESPCVNLGGPPALPPRSIQMEPPPRLPHSSSSGQQQQQQQHPVVSRKYSPCSSSINSSNAVPATSCYDIPPPLPPPRGTQNPPPTPPRGSTPPPPPPPVSSSSSSSSSHYYSSNCAGANMQPPPPPPPLLKRMSPVPVGHASRVQQPASVTAPHQRGTSPAQPAQVSASAGGGHPIRVHNSREIQQQLQHQLQTMQSLSMFPVDGSSSEPPPPYPMGTAAITSNPPPSYSQSLAMRQSPTLSSTSSDCRQSPAPSSLVAQPQPASLFHHHLSATSPIPASPSPSVMSSSSRTSSSIQPWSARQAKTHSPIIMQSVKSTQVQKPILQTATGINSLNNNNSICASPLPMDGQAGVVQGIAATAAAATTTTTNGGNPDSGPAPPPPSYEFSMQQKQQQQRASPVVGKSPTTARRSSETQQQSLPPPPPYPSTAVAGNVNNELVNGTNKQANGNISTAKVVSSNVNLIRSVDPKPLLQRKYSPLTSETGSSAAASRSESPASDSQTVSAASPLSFTETSLTTITPDSGFESNPTSVVGIIGVKSASALMPPPPVPPPPPYKTTHHTSPKPERRNVSPAKEEARRESSIRICPPQAFKFFMEQHVENVIKEYEQRRQRQMRLERELVQYGVKDPHMKEQMRMVLRRKETNYLRMRRAKLNKNHFKKIKTIGIGAFGEVSLVRSVNGVGSSKSGGLYAMKTLKKNHVVERKQVAHVIAEKDILAEADNDWIVKLYYSFQDKDNLYFVMEYIPGGDLMSMLIKEGRFSESLARFYIAELTCAVESVHCMGFVHRDIKPDNILIDAGGHIKLTDFGLCTGFRWTHNSEYYHNKNGSTHYRQDSMDPINMDLSTGNCSCPLSANCMKPLERRKQRQLQRDMAHSLVGTPNYIAPEVLLKQGYTQSCDWWSVGVILYEMIIGQPPFLAEDTFNTQAKVVRWRETLRVPAGSISSSSEDLIRGLCTDADNRLGSQNGAKDIKSHPFFKGIDFTKPLRDQTAPWRPEILYETDTSNFDPIDPERLMPSGDESDDNDGSEQSGMKKHHNSKDYHGFYEFTFRRFFDDGGHPLRASHYSFASGQRAEERNHVSNDDGGGGGQEGEGIDSASIIQRAPVPAPDPVYV